LEVDHYISACFVGENIVYGLERHGKAVSFRHQPQSKENLYFRMQRYSTGFLKSVKKMNVDNLKENRFTED
jgi:hypothetical protein